MEGFSISIILEAAGRVHNYDVLASKHSYPPFNDNNTVICIPHSHGVN